MAERRIRVGWRETKPTKPDGRVYAQLTWTAADGTAARATVGWTTPAGADLAAERKEAELFLGLPPSGSQPEHTAPSLGLLIGDYADDIETRAVGSAGYRTAVNARAVHLTRELGRIQVDKLTLRDLERYVADRKKQHGGRAMTRTKVVTAETGKPPKRVTVQDELRELRSVIDRTRSWGRHSAQWPGMPSFKGWPKDAKPARRLTAQEHHRLVEAAALDRPGLARLIDFAGWCPRRPVALFDMRRVDCARALDITYAGRDLCYFRRDKGGEALGWGPLLPEARAILVAHLAGTIGPADDLVWKPAQAEHYNAKVLHAALAWLCKKAKVPTVTPYDLRKLAAVRAYRACRRDLKAACLFTGHADEATLLKHYLYEEEDVVMAAIRGERAGDE